MTEKERQKLADSLDLAWREIGAVTLMLGRIAARLDELRKELEEDGDGQGP